jgi:eukaryotic-like serine/threonine-protein kinase
VAVALRSDASAAHNNLGLALYYRNQLDDAIAEYRRAIDLDLKYAPAHNNLGLALAAKQQLDKAIAEFKRAIDLDPKIAMPHYNLGSALQDRGQLDDAAAAYHDAIKLDPNYAETYCNLGLIRRQQGRFADALEFVKQGHALGSKRGPDWRYPSAQWVADAERLVKLEARLPAVLHGEGPVDNSADWLGLIEVCQLQQRNVAAAKLAAAAFAAAPKLADDLQQQHRYNAACYAALGAAGQGKDADKLDDQERARLRKHALVWLRADLDLWNKCLEGGKPEDRRVVRTTFEHWQHDADLIAVRDVESLKKLPADEQAAWRKLWADVAELSKKAGDAK